MREDARCFYRVLWRAVFGAAQYLLEAETLQQRRHIIFAVRCSHLRRRPPVPIKLPHVDVQRLCRYFQISFTMSGLLYSRGRKLRVVRFAGGTR